MKIPVRLVCHGCGRSVEQDRSRSDGTTGACPHCGGALGSGPESRPGGFATDSDEALVETVEPASPWSGGSTRAMPEAVGRFRPRTVLGGGGFGQVYLAYDPRLERDVALKVLKGLRPITRVEQRFFREARAAAQLDHPNIVPLHDAGRDSGVCWIAYQYVAGSTLSRYREEHPLDAPAAVRIVLALADALDHAHHRGVYHRDLKPANILVDLAGCPRLTDFGLARRVDVDPTMTSDGAILGTPGYMSPEQAAGQSHRADGRSDVYSLGVIFQELLTGRRPNVSRSETPPRGSALAPVRPPRSRDRRLPRDLGRICERALAPDPANRYPDARALANDLATWLRRRAFWARARRIAAMAAIVLVSTAIAVADALAPRGNRRKSAAPSAAKSPVPAPAPISVRVPPPIKIGVKIAPASDAFFAEKGKRFFHAKSCGVAHQDPSSDRHAFPSAEDARAQGFLPCLICKPR